MYIYVINMVGQWSYLGRAESPSMEKELMTQWRYAHPKMLCTFLSSESAIEFIPAQEIPLD